MRVFNGDNKLLLVPCAANIPEVIGALSVRCALVASINALSHCPFVLFITDMLVHVLSVQIIGIVNQLFDEFIFTFKMIK